MHNLTTPIELRRPALVHYGSGTLAKLADWVAAEGYSTPFVVADPINAARLEALGLGAVACFGEVVPRGRAAIPICVSISSLSAL